MAASRLIQSLGTVEVRTRREAILDRLRDAVIEGELPPGTHLGEIELSESLGVSRGTLREALRHLQQEGLLTADSRGRLYVLTVSPEDVSDIFQVRGALEGLGIEIACLLPDRTALVADLERVLERMDDPELTFAQRVQADLDFHETFLKAAGNATLVDTWRWISGIVRASIIAAGPHTALSNMRAERHRPIVDHIRDGDPAAARAYLDAHMVGAATHVIGALAR